MISFKKINLFFILPAALLLFLFLLTFSFNILIQNRSVQNILMSYLSTAAGYELKAGYMDFDFDGGLKIIIHDLSAKPKKGDSKLAIVRLEADFAVREILKGNFLPKRLFCLQPDLETALTEFRHPPAEGAVGSPSVNPSLLILQKILQKTDSAEISGGRIFLKNHKVTFNKMFVQLSHQSPDAHLLDADLHGSIEFREKKADFSIKGKINPDESLHKKPLIALILKAAHVPATWAPELSSLPVRKGNFDANIDMQVMPDSSILFNGRLIADNLCFLLDKAKGLKEYFLPDVAVNFQADYSKKIFNISSFNIKTSDYTLNASAKFDLEKPSDPYLDLKVTSPWISLKSFKEIFPSPLISAWLEESLYPCFTDGDVRFDLFAMQGHFSKFAHLYKYENANALFLKLSLKNMIIMAPKASIPYKKVCGSLIIENGALNVSGIRGIFGSSFLNDGKMNIDNLYSRTALYDYYLKGKFELGDIKQQTAVIPVPEDIKKQIQKIKTISGNVDAELRFENRHNKKGFKIKKSAFNFKKCSMSHAEYPFPLFIEEANFSFAENLDSQFSAQGMLGKSSFFFSGNTANMFTKGRAEIAFSADLNDIVNKTNYELKNIINFNGIMPGNLTISRQDDGIWSCEGEIDPECFINDKVEKKICFNLDIYPGKKIIFNKVNYNSGDTLLNLSGYFDLGDMDTLNIKLEAEPLNLEDFNSFFYEFSKPASGIIRCNADLQISVSDLSKTFIFGQCEADDISFSSCALPWEVKDCNFRSNFLGKKIEIPFFTSMLGENSISLNGLLRGWDGLKGEININAEYLKLGDLISVNEDECCKNDKKEFSDFVMNSDVKLNIKSKDGCWKQIEYNQLSAATVFRAGIFFVKQCEVKTETGKINLNGHIKSDSIKLNQDPESVFLIYVKLKEHPAKEIIQSLGIFKNLDIEGALLSTEGYIAINGVNKEEIISNLTGNFNILLEDGLVKQSNLLFAVLDFLSLNKIVNRKPDDLSKSGFYFKELKGNLDIKNGVLKTNTIAMQSPIFNMAGNGNVDLNNERIDLNLVVAPMGTIDFLISKIPFAGYILTGKDKSMVTFYLKVQDSLSEPKIKYIPFQHWPVSIFGFVKRAFLTPGRLYKDMTEVKKDFKESDILHKSNVPSAWYD